MKKLLLLVLAIFVIGVSAQAQQTLYTPTCSGIDDSSKFTALITAAAGNPRTIQVPHKSAAQRCALSAGFTFPSNITLVFTNGSGFNILSGTITIQGPVVSPLGKQIFFGAGAVSFSGNTSVSMLSPKWWGAVGNGVTDDASEMNATWAAAKTLGAATIHLPPGIFIMASALDASSSLKIVLEGTGTRGALKSELRFTGSGSGVHLNLSNSSAITIRDLAILYSNAAFTGYLIGPDIGDTTHGIHIDHCVVSGQGALFGGSAVSADALINLGNAVQATVTNNEFYYAKFGIATWGGAYSNVVRVEDNFFAAISIYAIANPINLWTIHHNSFEPNSTAVYGDGQTNGIAVGVNEAGVEDGVGAGGSADLIVITNNWFGDDTVAGGIRINYFGDGLTVANNYSNSSLVSSVFIRLRNGPRSGFNISGNRFLSANGGIFIDNFPLKFRGFCDLSNSLVPQSGTITRYTDPGYLMPSVGCSGMLLTTAQITTLAAQYVGEGADHIGVQVFDTTLNVPKMWDGTAFRAMIAEASSFSETRVGTCSLNMNSASTQDCYTNSTGKTLVVTRAVFRAATPGVFNAGSTTALYIKESAGSTFLGDGAALTGADNTASFKIAQTSLGTTNTPRVIANGAKAQVAVDIVYGSAQTCTVDIFGYFY